MAYLLENIPVRQLDTNGNPVAGALLYTYAAGTLTNQATYTDAGGLTLRPNPIVADAQGFWPQLWGGTDAYKLTAKTPAAVTLWERDNVSSIGIPTPVDDGDADAAFQVRTDTAIPHASMGLAEPDAQSLFALHSDTTRDGWGNSQAWLLELTRSINSNPPASPADPLNHGIRIWHTVDPTVTLPCREWVITAISEDFSGWCDSVALTGQVRRHANTNAMWSAQLNSKDYITGADLAACTRKLRGAEINVEGDGDDTAGMRDILFITSHRLVSSLGHALPTGTNRHHAGILVSATTADLYYGIRFEAPTDAQIDIAVSVACEGTTGVQVQGIFEQAFLVTAGATIGSAAFQAACDTDTAFMAGGTYAIAAFRMNAGEHIMLGSDTTTSTNVRIVFDDATRTINFMRGVARVGYIDVAGADHAL